jgi:hypothetical protein
MAEGCEAKKKSLFQAMKGTNGNSDFDFGQFGA